MVPYTTLPAWMYHAQLPPPTRELNEQVFGITWVDLVFPFFLFAMGVSIPLALGRRIESGEKVWVTALTVVKRGLALAAFSLVGEHLRPYDLSKNPDARVWLVSLIGFAAVVLALVRLPKVVPPLIQWLASALGWMIGAAIISEWRYPEGSIGFANYRNDIIIMVLANCAVSGGLIWIFTKDNERARLTIFGVIAAIILSATMPGLGHDIWNWDPTNLLAIRHGPNAKYLPIVYHFEFHKYLLMVIPGTLAGDAIRRLQGVSPNKMAWDVWRRFFILVVGPIAATVACIGLLQRDVLSTTIIIGVLATGGSFLVQKEGDRFDNLAAYLFRVGVPLLMIGLFAEPVGGGIRKDSPTFSYFFVTPGLASWCLASLSVFGRSISGPVWRLFRDTGANPIMAYVVVTNLTWGVVGLTGLEDLVYGATKEPWQLTGYALLKTLFVAGVTAWFSRRKVFLRA